MSVSHTIATQYILTTQVLSLRQITFIFGVVISIGVLATQSVAESWKTLPFDPLVLTMFSVTPFLDMVAHCKV